MRTVNGLGELATLAGTELGPGDWWEITQDRVDRFAEATDDPLFTQVLERFR